MNNLNDNVQEQVPIDFLFSFFHFTPSSKILKILSIFIFSVLLGLGVWFWNYDTSIAIFCLFQSIFSLTGLLINHNPYNNYLNQSEKTKPKILNIVYCIPVLIIGFSFGSLPSSLHFTTLLPFEIGLFIYALFAALAEEMFFRGFSTYFGYFLRQKFPKWTISSNIFYFTLIFCSALLWMVIHVNYYKTPIILLQILFIGILLEIFYLYRKNLPSVMLIHLIYNLSINFSQFFA